MTDDPVLRIADRIGRPVGPDGIRDDDYMTSLIATDVVDLPRPPPGRRLATARMSDVQRQTARLLTSDAALPVFAGYLTALVGAGESGKSMLAAHAVKDMTEAGHQVLVIDGEMSGWAWRARFDALNTDPAALQRIHYSEMTADAADSDVLLATVAHLRAAAVVWDSALSLISRTAKSENDNAEVARVLSRLRPVLRAGVGGLLVDHTAAAANGPPRSRGATSKFNELDVSFGIAVAPGSMPTTTAEWSALVTVEKDRHGLLPGRRDREVTFVPLSEGKGLVVDLTEVSAASNRFSRSPIDDIVARLEQLDPAPTTANEAHRRLGGTKQHNLAAFKKWKSQ